jgi:hypothetical protein
LRGAIAAAKAELGFAIPINSAAVADLPLHFEDRQLRPLPHLRQLDVVVPDRYDLVLSKLIRATQTDLLVCKEMQDHKPLDPAELIQRYVTEMKYAIGRAEDRDHNFVAAIEFIWDESMADRARQKLEQARVSSAALPPEIPRRRGRSR